MVVKKIILIGLLVVLLSFSVSADSYDSASKQCIPTEMKGCVK